MSSNYDVVQNPRLGTNGFQIKLIWDSSITEDYMKQIVKIAASILVNILTTKVEHEVIVKNMDSGLGQSSTSIVALPSYESFRTTYFDAIGTSSTRNLVYTQNLPEIDPDPSQVYFLTTTGLKAMGLETNDDNPPNEMFIHFAQTNYDLIAACIHELTESMGRLSGFTEEGNIYRSILDFCSFTSTNTHAVLYEQGAFFSINGGQNFVSYFNTNSSGDAMDWLGTDIPRDACNAFATAGELEYLSIPDLIALQSIGYNLASIEYIGDIIHIPIDTEITILSNNYSSILGISSFSITPELPSGLVFSTVDGSISGSCSQLTEPTLFTITLDSPWMSQTGGVIIDIVQKEDSGLDTGVIVAIAIVSVFFVAMLIVLAYFSFRPSKAPKKSF